MPAYETSNHARAGQESRHNLTYWRYQDYCGIGPGAHGRRGGMATTRHKKPENFLSAVADRGHGINEARVLDSSEQASEALLMGLRLREGIDLARLEARFGIGPEQLLKPQKVTQYRDLGLLWQEGERLGVTVQGSPLLDGLLGEIVADALVVAEPVGVEAGGA